MTGGHSCRLRLALSPATTPSVTTLRRTFAILLACAAPFAGCDGTIAGIGREPRPPETPLPPAPVETVGASFGEGPASARPAEIAASHLLVMYAGSKAAPSSIKRTKEQARARAEEALKRARAGEEFGKLVAEYSDEPGAASRGGALGRFSRDMMVKPFADAAFALKVGEVSDVVETAFGFHVIKRTE